MASVDTTWLGLPGARHIGAEELRALATVLERRTLYRGGGPGPAVEVAAAEAELADLLGRRHALLLNSGTSAMLTALVALGVGPGDEVVVPSYGWLGLLTTLAFLRAVPVLAPLTTGLVLDRSRLDRCLSSATRVVMPVHACGLPCPLPALASEHGPVVVDDGCQALGARLDEDRVVGGPGTLASVFSFQAYKVVSAGEGGALVTDDTELYRKAVAFHDAGLERFAATDTQVSGPRGAGLNLRMSELGAALIRVQLARLARVLDDQRAHYEYVASALKPLVASELVDIVEPATGERGNASFILLEAASPALGRALATHFRAHQIGLTLAADRPHHALPGWRRYLEASGIAHRVVDAHESLAILDRTLLLEINAELDDTQLRSLALAARSFMPSASPTATRAR
jgi:dTDP-4-amino-4,6-dideoxygalactose transaminase